MTTGVAAHIYSSAPGGPRGDGGLPPHELASESNGIWCCSSHAGQIDSDHGSGYTAGTLRGYKELAQARALVELRGGRVPAAGWFHELALSSQAFRRGSKLRFGKATLLIGGNATGKTVIASYLGGFEDDAQWERWLGSRGEDHRFSIQYFDPEPRAYGVTLGRSGIHRTRDGALDVPVGLPICVRYISFGRVLRGAASDLAALADAVGESRHVVAAALPAVASSSVVRAIAASGVHIEVQLVSEDLAVAGHWMPLHMLSAGEQSRVMLDVVLTVVRRRAQDLPTLLVVDDLPGMLSADAYHQVLDQLVDPYLPFQTLVLTREDPALSLRDGWARVHLVPQGHAVAIVQEGF
jgi:hypothetical protein